MPSISLCHNHIFCVISGSSPLYFAVRYGYTDMVKLLIREGKADVHQKRKLGLISPIGMYEKLCIIICVCLPVTRAIFAGITHLLMFYTYVVN